MFWDECLPVGIKGMQRRRLIDTDECGIALADVIDVCPIMFMTVLLGHGVGGLYTLHLAP
eukprot:5529433-Ditylum_brightwellii.AAC.1